jgi:hypothetical protein
MSVERRLREGLVRNAEAFDPQVERRLATLASRHRRRRRLRWAAAVVAAAAALATGALVAPGLLGERSHTEQVEVGLPTVSASPGQLLTGSYRTTVPAATGVVTSASLAGRWALTLRADGTMTIRAPAAYTGVLSGALFSSTSTGFRSNVFDQDLCSGLGVASYRWTRSGSALRFAVSDDTCAGRVAVFTSTARARIS